MNAAQMVCHLNDCFFGAMGDKPIAIVPGHIWPKAFKWIALYAVPPQNTSRICPSCGHAGAENRQTQADFACVQCGYSENADWSAQSMY
jgi:UDP-N-acetylmuramyl tripeptide synthase